MALKLMHCFWILSALFSVSIIGSFRTVVAEEAPLDHLVADKPKFTTRPETYRVVIGDTVALPCQVDHLGPHSILWKRGNAVLTARDIKIVLEPRIQLVNGFNLQIRKVRPQDAGDYVCQVSTVDTMEQSHTLEILVPPTVRTETHNGQVVINKGDSVNLQCRGSGNPVPTIRWMRKNNLNLPNGEQSVEGSSISIQKADRHQAGVYICTANNGVGTPVSTTIEVKIHYPPEIGVERGWIHSGEGHEAELACTVHADPPATVRWYRDTMILDTTDRRLVEERGNRHSLIIRKVQPSDFGNYSCEADNKLGRLRKHMELSGKPNRAVFRSDPNGRMRDTFNITWIVESYSPVTEHRLLYRKAHLNDTHDIPGEWNNVVLPATDALYNSNNYYTHQGNSLTSLPRAIPSLANNVGGTPASAFHVKSYHITNLEPETTYDAQVVARNKYGWAQASEIFQFHTRRTDHYPFESSPQHDILADPEVRDLGITAASSPANSIHPSFLTLIASRSTFTSATLLVIMYSFLSCFNLPFSNQFSS